MCVVDEEVLAMRCLLARTLLALTLVSLPAGGAAWAQSGGEAVPAAEDPAALLDQASAAYDKDDYATALPAARRAAELAPGKDSALAYQIWLGSAEQLGDLDNMAAALDAYSAVSGLGKSSMAIIDRARPRLEFYRAEQAGRVDAAAAALKAVRAVGSPSSTWLKMAEGRLALRKQLVQGQLSGLMGLTSKPSDSVGQQHWVRAVRDEAVGLAALSSCDYAGGLAAVDDLLMVPYRTPEERRRASALQVRLRAEAALLDPAQGDARVISKGLEALGEPSAEERVWMARVERRVELDAAWAAGRYSAVLDGREQYRSLAAEAPAEPACLGPKVWLDADDATWRAKEAEVLRLAEEQRLAAERLAQDTKQKKVSVAMFAGAGAGVMAAGAFGAMSLASASQFEALGEGSFTEFEASAPSLKLKNERSVIAASAAGAAATVLLSTAIVLRW